MYQPAGSGQAAGLLDRSLLGPGLVRSRYGTSNELSQELTGTTVGSCLAALHRCMIGWNGPCECEASGMPVSLLSRWWPGPRTPAGQWPVTGHWSLVSAPTSRSSPVLSKHGAAEPTGTASGRPPAGNGIPTSERAARMHPPPDLQGFHPLSHPLEQQTHTHTHTDTRFNSSRSANPSILLGTVARQEQAARA